MNIVFPQTTMPVGRQAPAADRRNVVSAEARKAEITHSPTEDGHSPAHVSGDETKTRTHSGEPGQPDSAELQQLAQLKSRDREVRAHEAAHKAVAGPYALGAPSYQFVTGSDGKQYAVGGEVKIDTSEIPNDPRATLIKAQTIRRAANAPLNPSSADRNVAAQASRMEAKARQEIAEMNREQRSNAKTYDSTATENEVAGTNFDLTV